MYGISDSNDRTIQQSLPNVPYWPTAAYFIDLAESVSFTEMLFCRLAGLGDYF